MLGFLLKYRARGLPELVIRRPSLPSMGLVFSPKHTLVSEEQHMTGSLSLENDNYHASQQLAAMFSLSDDSDRSSSRGSGEDRETEETRGLGRALDRLRSGLNSTRGFQRF